jgi:hypothetical protein
MAVAKKEAPVPAPEVVEAGAVVVAATGDAGFQPQPVKVKVQAKGKFLVGRSDIGTDREVTTADFASLGIEQQTLNFNYFNQFKLPLEGINPKAVEYLVENEYGFSVVEE